jgi:hypothetical protein
MIDYGFGFGNSNRNPETGVRFGYVALDSLDIYEELFGLKNPEEEAALTNYCRDRLHTLAKEGKVDFDDLPEYEGDPEFDDIHEEINDLNGEALREVLEQIEDLQRFFDGRESSLVGAEGEIDGVSVRVTEMGGALHLWVFDSPHIGWYEPCSLCVPGAANLGVTLEESLGLDRLPRGDLSKLGVLGYDVPPEWRYKG